MGSETLGAALRAAGRDDAVKAVVLRVDSPGGSYAASDAVRREVHALRESGTPVVASMGSVAASGGYFIAMPCEPRPGERRHHHRVHRGAGRQAGAARAARQGRHRRETVSVGRYADMFDTQRPSTTRSGPAWRAGSTACTTTSPPRPRPTGGWGWGTSARSRRAASGRARTPSSGVWSTSSAACPGRSDVACGLGGVERGDVHVRTYPRVSPFAACSSRRTARSPPRRRPGWRSARGRRCSRACSARSGVAPTGVLTMGLDVRLR